ncbi:helix-turn-helix transcriptional regulator [Phreatobacter sp. HK31-P]
MLNWSTDALPPHQRFDHWREERGRQLFGVTIEMPPERRHLFRGRFSARQAGGATIASLGASAYRVGRTTADIARLPRDALVIGFQIAGPGWCETRAGTGFTPEGGMAVGHSDSPYAATPSTEAAFLCRFITVPTALIGEHAGRSRGLSLGTVEDRWLAGLMEAMADALFDDRRDLEEDAAAEAVRDMARLALIARGTLSGGAQDSRRAMRTGLRHAALRIMRRQFHRHDLTPEQVAQRLGVSVRQLHLIFEPTGRSVQQTLTAIRIEEACRRLARAPDEAIVNVAFACGFDSLATFYRAFRRETGGTPGDFR